MEQQKIKMKLFSYESKMHQWPTLASTSNPPPGKSQIFENTEKFAKFNDEVYE